MMSSVRCWLFAALCAATLSGCQPGVVYHSYRDISSAGWSCNDTIMFRLPIRDEDKAMARIVPTENEHYLLEIGLRHTTEYPYRDIWIEIDMRGKSDTLHVYLADTLGHWSGSGTTGTSFQLSARPIDYESTGSDTLISVRHLMSDSLLLGITHVGIKLSLAGGVDTKEYE